MAYVREVRNRFERQPRTYEEFLNVMKDFKSGVCVRRLDERANAMRGRSEWNACVECKVDADDDDDEGRTTDDVFSCSVSLVDAD